MAAQTLPNNGIKVGYADGSDDWGPDMNRNLRRLDALLNTRVVDKDLSDPPSSPTVGQVYIVANFPGGAWSGHTKDLAIYEAGDDLLAPGWFFVTPKKGWRVFVEDEGQFYKYDTSWTMDLGVPPMVTVLDTVLTATPADAGAYWRWVSGSAKTLNFQFGQAYVVGMEFHGRNTNSGVLTIAGTSGMNVYAPTGGSLEVPPGSTYRVKIVGNGEADLAVF